MSAEFPAHVFRVEGDPGAVRGSAAKWSTSASSLESLQEQMRPLCPAGAGVVGGGATTRTPVPRRRCWVMRSGSGRTVWTRPTGYGADFPRRCRPRGGRSWRRRGLGSRRTEVVGSGWPVHQFCAGQQRSVEEARCGRRVAAVTDPSAAPPAPSNAPTSTYPPPAPTRMAPGIPSATTPNYASPPSPTPKI